MRTIADVLLPDGSNVNHALVKTLVLVVSEVCAREYDAREARSRGARIEDGAMGRPSSRTVVGLAKEREELGPVHTIRNPSTMRAKLIHPTHMTSRFSNRETM